MNYAPSEVPNKILPKAGQRFGGDSAQASFFRMLIIVSDLHLLDRPSNRFDSGRLVAAMRRALDAAEKVRGPSSIIFLGDTVDLLHSKYWQNNPVRPWHNDPIALGMAAESIVSQAIAANSPFFHGIKALAKDRNLEIKLVVGNHDALLNNPSARSARLLLRAAIGLESDADLLTDVFDEEHKLIAEHGHFVDKENWATEHRASAGDVAVIEVIDALPPCLSA